MALGAAGRLGCGQFETLEVVGKLASCRTIRGGMSQKGEEPPRSSREGGHTTRDSYLLRLES